MYIYPLQSNPGTNLVKLLEINMMQTNSKT